MSEPDPDWQRLVDGLLEGDELVYVEFWDLYGSRLQRLAEKNVPRWLQRRVGPEDVVQSACHSFLRRAVDGQFQLSDSESLWRLLCAITLTKVRKHVRYNMRRKRGMDAEETLDRDVSAADAPGPSSAVEFTDQFEALLKEMPSDEQRFVKLKLEQHTNREIAALLECSERTVRRILKRVQGRLREMVE